MFIFYAFLNAKNASLQPLALRSGHRAGRLELKTRMPSSVQPYSTTKKLKDSRACCSPQSLHLSCACFTFSPFHTCRTCHFHTFIGFPVIQKLIRRAGCPPSELTSSNQHDLYIYIYYDISMNLKEIWGASAKDRSESLSCGDYSLCEDRMKRHEPHAWPMLILLINNNHNLCPEGLVGMHDRSENMWKQCHWVPRHQA